MDFICAANCCRWPVAQKHLGWRVDAIHAVRWERPFSPFHAVGAVQSGFSISASGAHKDRAFAPVGLN